MPRFIMYQDSKKEWRWRFRADNNKITADSAEGYVNKADCKGAIDLIKKEASNAQVIELDSKPS